MTFAETERSVSARAAEIARAVSERGPSETWLPVLVDRSLDSALTLHALIRAGQQFVPLDHATPKERLGEIIERLHRPSIALVVRPEFADALPHGITPVHASGSTDERFDPVPVNPDGAAFVVFTSGSTGRPKAVVRRWQTFANRYEDQVAQAGCAPGAPWNAATMQPFTFSPGHRGLGAMALGRTMHIADPSTMSATALVQWFVERDINEATFSATLLRSMLDNAGPSLRLPTLRLVRLGSEASTWDLVAPIRQVAAADVTIVAGYSASEIGRTFRFEIPPSMPIGSGRIPLGTPLRPERVRLEPVDGDPDVTQLTVLTGESLGYLDDPELNERRYSPGPDGMLWWQSGDIAVVDDQGIFHHRGRIDDMVKINGLLVEPREAEVALLSIPGISAAAVLPQQRSNGKYRLIAHVVVDGDAITPASARNLLRSRLPAHLVPAVFVRHEALPVGERLKLDRSGLRSQPLVRWRTEYPQRFVEETTRWIVARAAEIVDLDDLTADEDLWEVGLDSLGAVELCAAVAEAGLGEVEPTVLLGASTPSQLADELRQRRSGNRSPVVVFNPQGPRDPMFAVPGGGGTALAFRSLAAELGNEQPLVVVEPRGLHQRQIPDHSVRSMARRVAVEVEARLAHGRPCTLIGYSSGATIAFEAAQQLLRSGVEVRLVFLDATVRGRDIEADLLRPSAGRQPPGDTSLTARRNGRTLRQLAAESPAITWRLALRSVRRLTKTWPQAVARRIVYRPWCAAWHDEQHYLRFGALIGRAILRYRAKPLDAHITVIESEAIGRGERTKPLSSSLTVLRCGGDHFTMLEPPHVHTITGYVRSVSEAPIEYSAP